MPEPAKRRSLAAGHPAPAAGLVARLTGRAAPGAAGVLVPLLAGLALALSAVPALAQYKWVGPDGSVHYGDRPPPGAGAGAALPLRAAVAAPAPSIPGSTAGLPYALRQAASRNPVTLYVTDGRAPCAEAREQLVRRGIPYSERVVRSEADVAAFRGLGFGELSFPALAVGSQRLSGFAAGPWNRALDAAGYPPRSQLPARWRAAAATPLAGPGGAASQAGGQAASESAAAAGDRVARQAAAEAAVDGASAALAAGETGAATNVSTATTASTAATAGASAREAGGDAAGTESTLRF